MLHPYLHCSESSVDRDSSTKMRRRTDMYAFFPSGENAIPFGLSKSAATTRTSPVLGSNRYTWLGNRGAGRKLNRWP